MPILSDLGSGAGTLIGALLGGGALGAGLGGAAGGAIGSGLQGLKDSFFPSEDKKFERSNLEAEQELINELRGLGGQQGNFGPQQQQQQQGNLGGSIFDFIKATINPEGFVRDRRAQQQQQQPQQQQPQPQQQQDLFDPIEARELQRYREETLPNIAQQFSGNLNSSSFLNALRSGSAGLSERLGALRYQHQQQQQQNQLQQQAQNLQRLGLLQNTLAGNRSASIAEGNQPGAFQQFSPFIQLAAQNQQNQQNLAQNVATQRPVAATPANVAYQPGTQGGAQGFFDTIKAWLQRGGSI